MDGNSLGLLFTNVILTASVGYYAWKRTRNTTKTIIVILIAIFSPIIALFAVWLMKPYKEEAKSNGMEQTQKEEVNPEGDLNSQVKHCNFCGAEIESDATYCNKCGRKLES